MGSCYHPRMTTPVAIGMPATDRVVQVPKAGPGTWGVIRLGGDCRDDYARIKTFHDSGGRVIVLQEAALESFKAAEDACGFPIVCTGTARACDIQRRLWLSDRSRFAEPSQSYHCRALAIDVSTDQPSRKLAAIHDALTSRSWHQARADEPWHWSFGGRG